MNKIQNIKFDIVEEKLYKLTHTYQEITFKVVPRERAIKAYMVKWLRGMEKLSEMV